MANTKKLKNAKQISIQIEQEDYNKLQVKVPNVTGFIRQYIHDFVNVENNLSELKIELLEKINQRDNLNIEIEFLESKILDLENTYKENMNNEKILSGLIETVNDIVENEYNGSGITRQRLKGIANNKISDVLLFKECEKQGIKIIKESEITNSNIRNPKNSETILNDTDKKPIDSIIRIFFRAWKSQHTKTKYHSKKKYLEDKEINKNFHDMCKSNGVKYSEFENYVLNNDK